MRKVLCRLNDQASGVDDEDQLLEWRMDHMNQSRFAVFKKTH